MPMLDQQSNKCIMYYTFRHLIHKQLFETDASPLISVGSADLCIEDLKPTPVIQLAQILRPFSLVHYSQN